MLAERGIDVSYETIRRWVLKFGPAIAANVRSEPILLKNSVFGQNWKIFPCTELERNFGEGLG